MDAHPNAFEKARSDIARTYASPRSTLSTSAGMEMYCDEPSFAWLNERKGRSTLVLYSSWVGNSSKKKRLILFLTSCSEMQQALRAHPIFTIFSSSSSRRAVRTQRDAPPLRYCCRSEVAADVMRAPAGCTTLSASKISSVVDSKSDRLSSVFSLLTSLAFNTLSSPSLVSSVCAIAFATYTALSFACVINLISARYSLPH
mmetsp:Transcript_29330/g.75603  ORF Transcript_29330/g.75603 Transcript_29330/m.75603 type:complete len:201 (+) Transcript_29330:1729-2331(+)